MSTSRTPFWLRVCIFAAVTCLVQRAAIAQAGNQKQESRTEKEHAKPVPSNVGVPTKPSQRDETQDNAETEKNKILSDCHYFESEGNPKKLTKALDCIQRRVAGLKRQVAVTDSLQAAIDSIYGASKSSGGRAETSGRENVLNTLNEFAGAPTGAGEGAGGGAAGQSATNTPTSCGKGSGVSNQLLRVHRVLMAPKNASDDFGHRIGRRFIVYQITIENDSKDFQFLIHDVSVDLGPILNPGSGSGDYLYTASSQELSLLRGIPEKGQDLDPRNLTLHVLQGIGSVAAGVAGLTPFADVMGPSMAVFNGPLMQGYIGIAPDHTDTQLNRLSDSAYIVNTLVEKQRAKTMAIFIPEATILSNKQQGEYWDNPRQFLEGFNLDQADVCVDGAFITSVPPPTLTKAVLTADKTGALNAGDGATLTITGTNLVAGDTEVMGLGQTGLVLTTANGSTGSVHLTMPTDYSDAMKVYLLSIANPSTPSATVAVTKGP